MMTPHVPRSGRRTVPHAGALIALSAAVLVIGRAGGAQQPETPPRSPPTAADSTRHQADTVRSVSPRDSPRDTARDSSQAGMPGMSGMSGADTPAGHHARERGQRPTGHVEQMRGMTMLAGPLGIPMTRQGSGTSWLPDAAPMHAHHFGVGDWAFMVHGVEFVQYDRQIGGDRGDAQFGGLGWLMGMASHPAGAGRLTLRGMFSADPWTVTERGYPLVAQSGESFDGAPLHDRQHPHDLFMELAAIYATPITPGLGLQIYAAPVGEPAVGPPAFPHRPSAQSDPFAPLSHHWQDATHIAYGDVTLGLFTRGVQLEGSVFNGREPDQHRADFDYRQHSPVLDSYAARVSANPAAGWSVSAWYAYLRSPEQLEPTVSQHRLGASILNARPVFSRGEWSSAFIYGANLYSNDTRLSNSVLLEGNLDLDGTNTVFGRIEYVTKSPADLAVPFPPRPVADRFDIASVGIGYVRSIGAFTRYGAAGLGAVVLVDVVPASLGPAYDTRTPHGFAIFLRLRPREVHGHQEMAAARRQ